jgi:hypothetical protein
MTERYDAKPADGRQLVSFLDSALARGRRHPERRIVVLVCRAAGLPQDGPDAAALAETFGAHLAEQVRTGDLCGRLTGRMWAVVAEVAGDAESDALERRLRRALTSPLTTSTGASVDPCPTWEVHRADPDAPAAAVLTGPLPEPLEGAGPVVVGRPRQPVERPTPGPLVGLAPSQVATEIVVPGGDQAPSQLRQQTRAVLHRWRRLGVADAVALAVTELVGDLFRAHPDVIHTRLRAAGSGVRVEVWGCTGGIPVVPAPETAGRGLALVRCLAADAGLDTASGDVPVLWCELADGVA